MPLIMITYLCGSYMKIFGVYNFHDVSAYFKKFHEDKTLHAKNGSKSKYFGGCHVCHTLRFTSWNSELLKLLSRSKIRHTKKHLPVCHMNFYNHAEKSKPREKSKLSYEQILCDTPPDRIKVLATSEWSENLLTKIQNTEY